MSFYTDLRTMADGLLTDKGTTLTLTKKTSGTYDPATGSATVTETAYSITAAVFDYPQRVIDGTRIQHGDKKVLVSCEGLTVDPDVDDAVTISSVSHQVVRARKISPAGEIVIWELQVRTP
jgi:hypothetical protein